MRNSIFISSLVAIIACGSSDGVPPNPAPSNSHNVYNHPPASKVGFYDAGQTSDANVDDSGTDAGFICVQPTCVRSFGYWKEHATWPCDEFLIAYFPSGAPDFFNESEALTVFHMPVNGNAVLILFDQLLPSILNGGENIVSVENFITLSRDWLMQYGFDTSTSPPSFPGYVSANSALGYEATTLASDLRNFNEGNLATYPSCSDCGRE